MRRFVKDFIKGLVVVLPVLATVYLVYLPLSWVDGLFGTDIPGLGVVVAIVAIWAAGVFASNAVGTRLLTLLDYLIERIPLLKLLYHTVKDLVAALVGDKKNFDQAVVVDLIPGRDVMALGFVTLTELDSIGLDGMVGVYLPQSYNFAGNLIVVPRDRIRPLNVEAKTLMTLIVSGGVASGALTPSGGKPQAKPEVPDVSDSNPPEKGV